MNNGISDVNFRHDPLRCEEGEDVDIECIQAEAFGISDRYWEYIMRHLYQDDYLEGIALVSTIGRMDPGIKINRNIMITPKGINFLQNNSAMSKARDFLKTIKDTVPGL